MSGPKYDFEGQVALVTGAGSGMGLATARAFAVAGASAVLADLDDHALRAASDELTAAGHQALAVVCDVTDEDQVAALLEKTVAAYGRLDMAFNNAGIMIPPSDAANEPADNFDRVNAINLRGVRACMNTSCDRCASKEVAPLSTALPSAVSSGFPAAPPTTPQRTACSD